MRAGRPATVLVSVIVAVTIGLPGHLFMTNAPMDTTAHTSLGNPTKSSQAPAFTGPLEAGAEHTPAPPPTPRTLSLARSEPSRIQIPAIGVDSDLMALGLRRDGSLQTPPEGFPAGWYTGASAPGELGPAIIAGHVDWNGKEGVFFRLRDLQPGDEILVARADGSTAVFRVAQVESFAKSDFPTELVYGPLPYAGLRLITCGGSFDRQRHHYVDNVVVFAELVGSNTG